jgi:hypothetical protein
MTVLKRTGKTSREYHRVLPFFMEGEMYYEYKDRQIY